jgi:hypothetical protein
MLTIDGTNRDAILLAKSLLIEDNLTNQVDTCRFSLRDPAGTFVPALHSVVEITVNSVLVFGGIISDCSQREKAPSVYAYDVNCVDYSDLLRRHTLTEVYQNMTCGAIIADILADYVSGITMVNVQAGATINYISFNWQYPFDCIQELADLTGYDWYVDANKDLHFFSLATNAAPYALTDTSGYFKGLSISVDKSQIRNRVTVRGGYELSELYTADIQTAIAGQTVFGLKYKPYSPVTLFLNSLEKTLGIENIDQSGTDFVLNQSEKLVKCLDHAPLSAGDSVNVRYKYQIPVFAQGDDSDSIKAIEAIEGVGNGVYEGELIVDETIQTKAAARDRVKAELDMYANPLVNGSFTTFQFGYRSGQVLTVDIASRGVNAKYLIQSVTLKSLGGDVMQYSVRFATRLKGLTEFLLELFDRGKQVFERNDEILDVYKLVKEAVTVSDAVPTHTTRTPSTTPYTYDDAGTRYNLAVYS